MLINLIPLSCTVRFTIYLQTGSESEPEQVAFVFDVRFNYGGAQNRIVTNHKKHGAWGQEEDGDGFPFFEEEEFKIKIIVDDDSFKVNRRMKYSMYLLLDTNSTRLKLFKQS